MARDLIQIQELNNAIEGILDEYNANVVEGLKAETKSAMKDLVKKSKDTAPVGKRTKHYKDNIASRTLSENSNGITKQWYVKGSDYRLTHLLNNGHQLRNGDRYNGTNFLGKAVDSIVGDYVKKVEDIIKNG